MSATPSSAAIATLFSTKTPSLLISNSDPKIKFRPTVNRFPRSVKCSSDSATVVDNSPGPSLQLEEELDESAIKAMEKIGSRVRVTAPLKVYHVPKVPEFDLSGRIGVFKQYAGVHKGKQISANLPFKIEFVVEDMEARKGKGPLKFFAHLREDEFEFLD